MKTIKNELDVVFIGGSEALTKEEQEAISNFIKTSKERRTIQQKTKKTIVPQEKKPVA